MPQADKASLAKTILKRLDNLPPRPIVKIDQHVTAENNVDVGEPAHLHEIAGVHLFESHRLANRVDQSEAFGTSRHEILPHESWCQAMQRPRIVDTALRRAQDVGVNVGRHYLDVVFIDLRPVLKKV